LCPKNKTNVAKAAEVGSGDTKEHAKVSATKNVVNNNTQQEAGCASTCYFAVASTENGV
jgi:hypothetical protein